MTFIFNFYFLYVSTVVGRVGHSYRLGDKNHCIYYYSCGERRYETHSCRKSPTNYFVWRKLIILFASRVPIIATRTVGVLLKKYENTEKYACLFEAPILIKTRQRRRIRAYRRGFSFFKKLLRSTKLILHFDCERRTEKRKRNSPITVSPPLILKKYLNSSCMSLCHRFLWETGFRFSW